MKKRNSQFRLGMVFGLLGGVLIARKIMDFQRMPNGRVWQRILAEDYGEVDAAILMARVQNLYNDLKSRRPLFDNLVFNLHIIGGILPGLALYQVLREDGMSQDQAITEIDRLFEIWFDHAPPLNMRLNQLMAYTPENFNVFRKLVRFTMDKFFPSPGWEYEVVTEDENTFAFNIHNCFYLKVLQYYNAPELTPVFCRLDDYLMGAMPSSIQWGRTKTIGLGAECCNFRWDYLPVDRNQRT